MPACAFTGHRPSRFIFQYDEQHPLCEKIKCSIAEHCHRLYKTEAVRVFYTGCALGVDLWAAEAVLQMKVTCSDVKLVCAAPYPGHDEKWPDAQKKRLARIMAACDEAVTVCDKYSEEAYKLRNYYMVDRAEFLIAVYDQSKNMRSGTMQTVNYAKKQNKNIIFIHPDTGI